MNEHRIVRQLLCRMSRGVPDTSPLALAVAEWARPHIDWLYGRPEIDAVSPDTVTGLQALVAGVEAAPANNDARPQVLGVADTLASLLVLDPFDAALLAMMVAGDRLPRVGGLARIAARHGHDLPTLLGELAGAAASDAERLVRRSPVLRLGLIGFVANRQGEIEVEVRWTLERLLDRALSAHADIVDTLVGPRQTALLSLDDFAGVADADLVRRLLAGAVCERAPGINVLIHGPPGTGKTEFARTIAAATGAALHAVGEVDEDGEEPTRWERVNALQIAQRMLRNNGGSILLFDEMEDMIGDARPSGGDWFAKREGSKVFVNRMLETNPVPVIWTTNAIGNIDNAVLRRMSFVLKLDLPSRAAALRMADRIAVDEQVAPAKGFGQLLDLAPETATVLRVATRAGRLAGDADSGVRAAEGLVKALRGGSLPVASAGLLDLDLFECDVSIDRLTAAMAQGQATDVSLLLSGPPGTGKTAFAHHLARALDRPLLVKRASDLLSKWVGETEAQIADAFDEARRREGVLLFDEVDSLLFDRTTARNSWEVSQVNELLSWLDTHPLPVIAATNHPGKLDPATLRRFVFKLSLEPLGHARAARAFERFFGMAAPVDLVSLTNLTPGDFAVVTRQRRHAPTDCPVALVERLRVESQAKPERNRIGF
jgi:transitional endoplasmic reticulum ATPase